MLTTNNLNSQDPGKFQLNRVYNHKHLHNPGDKDNKYRQNQVYNQLTQLRYLNCTKISLDNSPTLPSFKSNQEGDLI